MGSTNPAPTSHQNSLLGLCLAICEYYSDLLRMGVLGPASAALRPVAPALPCSQHKRTIQTLSSLSGETRPAAVHSCPATQVAAGMGSISAASGSLGLSTHSCQEMRRPNMARQLLTAFKFPMHQMHRGLCFQAQDRSTALCQKRSVSWPPQSLPPDS